MHWPLSPLKRGRKRHEKNRKFSSYFAFQNQLPATPCSGPQLLVEERRLGGYSPRFGERRKASRKNSQFREITLPPCCPESDQQQRGLGVVLYLWCPGSFGATMGGGRGSSADGGHQLQPAEPAGAVPAVPMSRHWFCHHGPSPHPLSAGAWHPPQPAGAGGRAAGAMVQESPRDDLRALRPGDQGKPVDPPPASREQTL